MAYMGDHELPVKNIVLHKKIKDVVLDLYEEMLNTYTLPVIQENKWDEFGGCFNFRIMRGYNAISTHAFGIAIDQCPSKGAYGNVKAKQTFPQEIVLLFTSRGFDWGGSWPEKYQADCMHFQACTGY